MGIITNNLHNQFAGSAGQETALEVVLSGYHSSLGVYKFQKYTDTQYKEAQNVLEFLGITDISNKKVCEMSTGQLRRCVIGRSLVHNPEAFILDEPTTGLDIKAQYGFMKILRKLAKHVPVILVTHNIEEIFPEITHVALMYNQTIYKQGRKEDILNSENLSKIFEIKLDLQKQAERYIIKI